MAFDNTDPTDIAELQTEVNTDPIGMGYAGTNNTNQKLDLLNDPANNVGGETAGEAFTPRLMLDVIVPDDMTPGGQMSQGELEWIKMLLEASNDVDDENLAEFRGKFRQTLVDSGATASVTALDAATRPLSRAEVLWGEGTIITRDDWFAAFPA